MCLQFSVFRAPIVARLQVAKRYSCHPNSKSGVANATPATPVATPMLALDTEFKFIGFLHV